MLGDGQEGLARGVHHFGLVALRLIEAALPLRDASLLAKADDRVLRDVKARADVRHRHADRVETSNLSALGHGERGELDPMRQTRQGYSPIVSGKVVRQARDQVKERLPLFREGVGEGHHYCIQPSQCGGFLVFSILHIFIYFSTSIFYSDMSIY